MLLLALLLLYFSRRFLGNAAFQPSHHCWNVCKAKFVSRDFLTLWRFKSIVCGGHVIAWYSPHSNPHTASYTSRCEWHCQLSCCRLVARQLNAGVHLRLRYQRGYRRSVPNPYSPLFSNLSVSVSCYCGHHPSRELLILLSQTGTSQDWLSSEPHSNITLQLQQTPAASTLHRHLEWSHSNCTNHTLSTAQPLSQVSPSEITRELPRWAKGYIFLVQTHLRKYSFRPMLYSQYLL